MPLHPKLRALLIAQRAADLPPLHTLSIEAARRDMRTQAAAISGPPVEVDDIENTSIDGPGGTLPVRIYDPGGEGRRAGLVFFHSGGYVVGDLDTHDALCRRLCAATGALVCAVEYRLAPEHPFPAAADDALAATRGVAAAAERWRINPARLGVIGDSAGGGLATVAALRCRDEGGPALASQVLIYPMLDHYSHARPSYTEFGEGYGLTRDAMVWFWDKYLPDPSAAVHPHACPLQAADLAGLPPALVLTAECDVLRDEGELYAQRLAEAGVAVTSHRLAGMNHGFIRQFTLLEEAAGAVETIAGWLRQQPAAAGRP